MRPPDESTPFEGSTVLAMWVPDASGGCELERWTAIMVERVKERDAEALEALYVRYRQNVYRHSLRIIRCHADSEEVIQDVFLSLWRWPPETHGSLQRFRSWLYLKTKDVCWKLLQRQRLRGSVLVPYDSLVANLGGADTSIADVIFTILRERLEQAIVRTCPELRGLWEMRFVEQMAIREIAATLGLPLITVQRRLEQITDVLRGIFSRPVLLARYSCDAPP
jgi:RNA polymerase sigma-70 factor, ECF subfamily